MKKNEHYPYLFTPGKIGPMELKNRIVQGPMEMQASGFNGEMSDDYIEFYEASAKAGTGLIITAYASVDDEFSQSFDGAQLKVTHNLHTAGMSKLARRVHKYNAKVIVQIYMAGRQAVPTAITGKRMVAPSPIGFSWHNQIPEEMTIEEIKAAVKKFGRAALILKHAEIDGAEVLAAGGYLINEFLSSATNKRTDEYGGSFENRTRFVREIVEEIRRQCGADFAISVRFSADEFLDDGYDLSEGVRLAKFFESIGVDCININNSNQEKRYYIIEPIGLDSGWKSYIIKAIKEAVSIPVLSTNVIKKPEQAEKYLSEGLMDYAVMARAFLADIEWSRKAREGRSDEIKPCIGCLHCLTQTGYYRRSICAVNPKALRLDEFADRGKDLAGKRIIVVGAGPAGMEAAIECKRRGADVVVYEKTGIIGGAAELGSRIPNKAPLKMLADYYATMAERMDIDVRTGTEATAEMILAKEPYAVFVATGAAPCELPFMRPDGKRVFTVEGVLGNRLTFKGKKVAVIGGGMNGCEIAEYCALSGSEVTQVVIEDALAENVDRDCLEPIREHMEENNGKVLLSHKTLALEDDGVLVEEIATGEQFSVPADIVVAAVGSRPDRAIYDRLSEEIDNVILVGDAVKVGRVEAAVRTGYEQAYVLE